MGKVKSKTEPATGVTVGRRPFDLETGATVAMLMEEEKLKPLLWVNALKHQPPSLLVGKGQGGWVAFSITILHLFSSPTPQKPVPTSRSKGRLPVVTGFAALCFN